MSHVHHLFSHMQFSIYKNFLLILKSISKEGLDMYVYNDLFEADLGPFMNAHSK